jgi:WD40 repeat protein
MQRLRNEPASNVSVVDITTASVASNSKKGNLPRVMLCGSETHKDEVWRIAWSHDGRYLASASRDKMVLLWTICDNLEVRQI